MSQSDQLVQIQTQINLVLAGQGNPKAAAAQLVRLPPEDRALMFSAFFNQALQTLSAKEASDGAERLGRRAELILDEMPNRELKATVTAMIEAEDTSFLLSMLRGNASGISTIAQFLTEELLEELFTKDADLAAADLRMKNENEEERVAGEAHGFTRTIGLLTTLLESPTRTILLFLIYNPTGREVMQKMYDLVKYHENSDAEHLVQQFRTQREELDLEGAGADFDI